MRFFRLVFVALAVVCAPVFGLASSSEFIFVPGSAGFASSHASTVVELKDGALMAAWFGGTGEGKPDVAIWGSRHTDRGWSKPAELVREAGVACWNPVLFHAGDGKLWLYYKFGPNPAEWTGARRFSLDEGMTWSAVEHLPAGIIGPVRAKPLVMAGGTIVSGSSVEAYRSWAVWLERSIDNGATWSKVGPLVPEFPAGAEPPPAHGFPNFGIIQPSVVEVGPKHLRFYARSTEQIARVCVSDSLDGGLSWTRPRALEVRNPNSGIDAVALRGGSRVVLVYNDTAHGRSPLNLAISEDGEHFRNFRTLESEDGEFSYPAMIETRAGDLEITYTWNRKTIKHVHMGAGELPR